MRKRMAKLGFVSDINPTPAFKIEAFLVIDHELEKIQAREAKRKG